MSGKPDATTPTAAGPSGAGKGIASTSGVQVGSDTGSGDVVNGAARDDPVTSVVGGTGDGEDPTRVTDEPDVATVGREAAAAVADVIGTPLDTVDAGGIGATELGVLDAPDVQPDAVDTIDTITQTRPTTARCATTNTSDPRSHVYHP